MPRVCPTCGKTYDEQNVFCPADGSSLRTTGDSSELLGSVIADRYLITEQLGEGGMGRVYLAQHVRLPQRAAIKVLHPALAHDTDALARFNREASNACQISHQHVARVYDFGEGGPGLVYLAMEYVPGPTLSALLDTAGPLAPMRATMLLRQIADGLDAAHKLGIVHRDLKPDNILVVREDDGTEQVKVVDFGIAKAMDSRTQGVTRTGLVVGTALYMSPEQVSGHVIDKRSDVYALGLVAFVMLTGKLPFPGDTAEEAMIRRLTERPLTLTEAYPETPWPAAVQTVMDRALAREIVDRYPSASAFAKAMSDAVIAWQQPGRAAPVHADAVAVAEGGAQVSTASSGSPAATGAEVGAGASGTPPNAGRTRLFAIGGGIAALAAAAILAVTLWPPIDEPTQSPRDSITIASSNPAGGDGTTGPTGPVGPGRPSGNDSASGSVESNRGTAPPDPTGTIGGGSGEPSSSGALPPLAAERTAPPRTSAASEGTRAAESAALARLDTLIATLHPDVISDGAALRAVAGLEELLPFLRTARDSVRADLNRANAYFFLQQIPEACAVLGSLRNRATIETRGQIDAQLETLGCP